MRNLRLTVALSVLVGLVSVPGAAAASHTDGRWRLSENQLPVNDFRIIGLKLDEHRAMWFGGASVRSTPEDSRRVFIYDTRNRRFHEVASLPGAKNITDQPNDPGSATNVMVAGVLADGSVVATGGLVSPTDPAVNAQNVLSYRYYPTQDRWARTGDLPEPQQMSYMPSDLLHDGRLLVIGGVTPQNQDSIGQKSKAAFVYSPRARTVVDRVDPDTGQPTGQQQDVRGAWDYTRTADGRRTHMSEPHDYGNSVLLPDGRVLVTGGHVQWGDTSVMSTHTDFFDPHTGTWAQGPVLPVVAGEDDRTPGSHGGRANGVCMTALPDGRVVIAGGASGTDGAEFFSTMISRQSILILKPAKHPMASTIELSPAVIPSPAGNGHLNGDEGRLSLLCWTRGDGKILFAGGQSSYFEDLFDSYVFDPGTDAIDRVADLPHGVAKWAADPGSGYPADYQCARIGTLSVAMRDSRLVFDHGTVFLNGGGVNATSATGPNGVPYIEQLG